MKVFGKDYNREALLKKTGNLDQLFGLKEYTYSSGKAKNIDAIDIDAGNLKFTVFVSRCLDIGQTYYKGIPLGYVSKSGLRSPEYFVENKGKGFLDSFYGGLLTTSGLNNIGTECEVEGREYGVHGEIANIPAENVCKKAYWEADDLCFDISGDIHHSRFYAEDLVMKRTIQTKAGANKLLIRDVVWNGDFAPVPLMLLYHINLGFPLLDSISKLIIPNLDKSWPRNESARIGLKSFNNFIEPEDGVEEECFYHSFKGNTVVVCLYNPSLGDNGLGFYLKYDKRQLPVFLQWKMMRSREYVCGFAPATNFAEGRGTALQKKEALYINPMEKKEFLIELGVIESIEELQKFEVYAE